jgi:hypothetical protein
MDHVSLHWGRIAGMEFIAKDADRRKVSVLRVYGVLDCCLIYGKCINHFSRASEALIQKHSWLCSIMLYTLTQDTE